MTVHGPNGSWRISLLKEIPPITWVDRAIMRLYLERNTLFGTSFKQWNVSIQAFEIITNDPSTLPDEYLDKVNRRLINGTATERDWLYANEINTRIANGSITAPEIISFIQGRGDKAIKRTVDIPSGYKKTKLRSHGQPVFTNGSNWITPDQDGHNGGVWKMFDNEKNLGSTDKGKRVGTFDANLNRVGD